MEGLFTIMSTIDDYLISLQNIEGDLSEQIQNILINNQGKIVGTIKLRLYNHGVDASGNLIGEYYFVTQQEKRQAGKRASFITLRDTGDWYAGMFVDYIDEELIIDSSDFKTEELVSIYGEDILGLTEEEQEWLIFSILEPEIQKYLDSRDEDIEL